MRRIPAHLLIIVFLALITAACSGGDSPDPTAGELTVCGVDKSLVGTPVTVQGEISFIDESDPSGIYFELMEERCRVGLFIQAADWSSLQEMDKARFQEGNQVRVHGLLTSFEGELVIEYFGDPDTPPEEMAESDPESAQPAVLEPARLSYQSTNQTDTRWQEFTLTFTDEDGNPVPELEVEIDQVDIDFFFDSSNCPQCAWTEIVNGEYQWNTQQKPNAKELIHDYLDLGFNAEVAYFGIWWNEIEPNNNEWTPILCQFSLGEFPCIGAVQGEIWDENPRPNRFFYADLGPDFRFNHSRELWRPAWLNLNDEPTFKTEFEEYMAEIIRRGEINLDGYDLYMIGYESAGGADVLPWSRAEIHSEQWVQEWVDFFDWQIKTIHHYDPDAVIGLNLHSIGWNREIMNLPANMAPQPLIEGLIAKDAEFDIIGFEIHPGASSCEGDSREFNQQFLDLFKQYGKKIYLWEYGASSRGSLPVEKWCENWDYSVDAMDHAYQDRVFMDIFDLFFQDPAVVGIRILSYIDVPLDMRDPEDLWTREVDLGLLNQDGSKKPVLDSLKAYWQDQMTSFVGETDENGQVIFQAVPGIFNITSASKTATAHFHPQGSIFSGSETDLSYSLMAATSADIPSSQEPPAEEPASAPDDFLLPCDLTNALLGQEISVAGMVQFVDQGSEGIFFELEDQGCSIGVFVETSDWDQWPSDAREDLQPGKFILIDGTLGDFQGELEVEVIGPPMPAE